VNNLPKVVTWQCPDSVVDPGTFRSPVWPITLTLPSHTELRWGVLTSEWWHVTACDPRLCSSAMGFYEELYSNCSLRVTASSDVPLYLSYSPSDLLDHHLDVSCRLHSAELFSSGSAATQPPTNTSAGPAATQAQTGSGQTGSLGQTGSSQSGSAVDLVQHELSLLHAELMFEKQRRDVHARRSRRLLARINQLNSLADHNEAVVGDIIHFKPLHF